MVIHEGMQNAYQYVQLRSWDGRYSKIERRIRSNIYRIILCLWAAVGLLLSWWRLLSIAATTK